MRTISGLAGVAAVALTALGAAPVQAAYPERPITLIVPWGAGGGTEVDAGLAAVSTDLEQRTGDLDADSRVVQGQPFVGRHEPTGCFGRGAQRGIQRWGEAARFVRRRAGRPAPL